MDPFYHVLHLPVNANNYTCPGYDDIAITPRVFNATITIIMFIAVSNSFTCNTSHCDSNLFGTNFSLKVCIDLHDPTVRMNEAQMSLFSPFRPMLAERGALEEASKPPSVQ